MLSSQICEKMWNGLSHSLLKRFRIIQGPHAPPQMPVHIRSTLSRGCVVIVTVLYECPGCSQA